VLIGASKVQQIIENAKIITAPAFTADELSSIDKVLASLNDCINS